MKRWYTLVFLLGFFSCAFLFFIFYFSGGSILGFVVGDFGDVESPSDWIVEEDIVVLGDRVVLRVVNATVSDYSGSGSMKPLFDEGANGIRIVPSDESEVGVGDIVSFRFDGIPVIHRVVEKGIDGNGVYFVTKGDNNLVDDGKIRFSEIEYVTIAVVF